jgi:hypothetical protein
MSTLWVEKSIELANKPGYLDNLYAVYPMEAGQIRELQATVLKDIRKSFDMGDKLSLIKILLKNLDLFPIKDSYIAFLRKNPSALDINPKTVDRIGRRLLRMGYEEVIKASTQPKETNRQIGPLFHKWLPTLGYPVLPEEKFISYKGTAFLEGSDKYLKDFSNRVFKTRLTKGLDLLLRVNGKFIIGESKFLTDFGGHQNAQFNDAINLLRSKSGNAIKLAILDGILWIKGNNKMHSLAKKEKGVILSSLLLDDFIRSLQ